MSYRSTILATSGLVGYWRFGESSDANGVISERGPNGTFPTNRPNLNSPGAILGDTNTCYRFASSNSDYVYFPGNYFTFANKSHFSIELWYQPTLLPTSGFMTILSKARYDGSASGYELFVDGVTKRLKFTRVSWQQGRNTMTGPIVQVGEWYHIVVTYDGEHQRMYINGGFSHSTPDTYDMSSNTSTPLYVGRTAMGGEYVSAYVDELAIYNRQLTTPDINGHYEKAMNPVVPEYGAFNRIFRSTFGINDPRRRRTSRYTMTTRSNMTMDSHRVVNAMLSPMESTFNMEQESGVSNSPTINWTTDSDMTVDPVRQVRDTYEFGMIGGIFLKQPTKYLEEHHFSATHALDLDAKANYRSGDLRYGFSTALEFSGMSRVELDALYRNAARQRTGAIHYACTRLSREQLYIRHKHTDTMDALTITPFVALNEEGIPRVVGTATIEWYISRVVIDATTRIHDRLDILDEFSVTYEVMG